jgi:uncharacterized hydrophobic protein (TIGR00271 family)
MSAPQDDFLGELRLGHQLTSASQAAAGGLAIILGFIFLLSGQVLVLLGPRAPLAGILTGLVLGLTLLNVVELLGGSSERGGTYILVHETLGGWLAFLTGWGILAGSVALTAAMAQQAGVLLLGFVFAGELPANLVALGFILFLILIQLFQLLPRRFQFGSFLLAALAALALVIINAIPQMNMGVFRSPPSVGLGTFNQALAWLSVGYIAFESLLISRRQIRDSGRLLPQAILGLLILGVVLISVVLFIYAALLTPITPPNGFTISGLALNGFLPDWFTAIVALVLLLVAANGCMMTAARQVHALSMEGAFPRGLRRVWGKVPMPVLLFSVLTAGIIPVVLFAPLIWSVYFAGSMFLGAMTILDISAIYSRQTEPRRRRAFVLPFSPLFPALAVAVNLILFNSLPYSAVVGFVGWWLIGSVFYLVYARYHQVQAQEGEIVFGRVQPRAALDTIYRILVPIGPNEERYLLLRMAADLARQLHGEVIPLQVIAVPDPLAIEEGRRMARERNALFRWSMTIAGDLGVPIYPITRLARSVPDGIIDTAAEESCNLVFMAWPAKSSGQEARIGSILSLVARGVSSDVAVVAYHPAAEGDSAAGQHSPQTQAEITSADMEDRSGSVFHLKRVLVPTSGGPHAPLATQLALLLARENEATVTAVYVATSETQADETDDGEKRIQETIATMREQASRLDRFDGNNRGFDQVAINGQVISANSVVEGISEAGFEFDLVLIGASEESLIDQVLFGSIPEQVARECPAPVIIVKHYRGLPRLWLMRTWIAIFEALPTLSREEQIDVYREVHREARPDVDFFVMIGLSTLIATFGLLQGSTAVIIGAMLVAPLFSPLLALSLAITQGNVRLLRIAIESTVKGIALAVGLAFLLALIAPSKVPTPQITSRSLPNLFDLAVALASGAAGAYAIARKDVAAALPGVAIAAAMVPPLGVIGIGLAMGSLSIAGGGGLLFLTNLVAIALAGSFTFLLLGFRPGAHGAREVHLRRGLITTIVLFVLITIPLILLFAQTVKTFRTRQIIQTTVAQYLTSTPDIELVSQDEITFVSQGNQLMVTIPVYIHGSVQDAQVKRLSDELTKAIGEPVLVRMVTYTILESSP